LNEAKEITTELFSLYIENAIKLCVDYGIEPEIFKSIMNKAFLRILEENNQKPSKKTR